VALPALAHGPLNAGATGYGIILAAFGGGALLSTVLVVAAAPLAAAPLAGPSQRAWRDFGAPEKPAPVPRPKAEKASNSQS
jgi:hypothetical protein